MQDAKHHLAALVAAAHHLSERERLAAFLRDAATRAVPNPFARTQAGAACHTWSRTALEHRYATVHSAGVTDLLAALAELPAVEPLHQEMFRSGAHTATVFLTADRSRVVGAVLYGKPGILLPQFVQRRARPRRRPPADAQLDLFAGI